MRAPIPLLAAIAVCCGALLAIGSRVASLRIERGRGALRIALLLRGSGRGVMLMQSFMDEFQISQRQPQGTEVKMVKYKAKAT